MTCLLRDIMWFCENHHFMEIKQACIQTSLWMLSTVLMSLIPCTGLDLCNVPLQNDLAPCVALFQQSKGKVSLKWMFCFVRATSIFTYCSNLLKGPAAAYEPIVKDTEELMSLALKCIYVCDRYKNVMLLCGFIHMYICIWPPTYPGLV